jgi:hypothetical protein
MLKSQHWNTRIRKKGTLTNINEVDVISDWEFKRVIYKSDQQK